VKFKYRRYYFYYLARSAAFLVSFIPVKLSVYLADLLGGVVFSILGKYRNIAIDNLTYAFGSTKTPREIRTIARNVFRNLCRNGIELLHFPRLNKENIKKFVLIKNRGILDKAFEKGRGVLVLTAHIGNWELVGLGLRLAGYEGAAIGRRIYFYKYDKFLNEMRRANDVNIVYRDDPPKKILKILRENKIMGLLADQDVDSVDGVFVDFFGRPAYTPVGPVLLARVSGAPLVPVFAVREHGRHALYVGEPIELVDTGDKKMDAVENTRRWSKVLESFIRKYPEQWVWIHRRWKTQK